MKQCSGRGLRIVSLMKVCCILFPWITFFNAEYPIQFTCTLVVDVKPLNYIDESIHDWNKVTDNRITSCVQEVSQKSLGGAYQKRTYIIKVIMRSKRRLISNVKGTIKCKRQSFL